MINCGYQGHVCGTGRVQFISRYRNVNDYCVDGCRISVADSGEATANYQPVAAEIIERIRLFELAKYAEYIQWHIEASTKYGKMQLQPFTFAA